LSTEEYVAECSRHITNQRVADISMMNPFKSEGTTEVRGLAMNSIDGDKE
jgi:hypothetical protein